MRRILLMLAIAIGLFVRVNAQISYNYIGQVSNLQFAVRNQNVFNYLLNEWNFIPLFPDSLASRYYEDVSNPANNTKYFMYASTGFVFDPYSYSFDPVTPNGLFGDRNGTMYGYRLDTLTTIVDYRLPQGYNPLSPDTLRFYLAYMDTSDVADGMVRTLNTVPTSYALCPKFDYHSPLLQKGAGTLMRATTMTVDYILTDADAVSPPPGWVNRQMLTVPIPDGGFEVPAGKCLSVVAQYLPGFNYNLGDTIEVFVYDSYWGQFVAQDIKMNRFNMSAWDYQYDPINRFDKAGFNTFISESQAVRHQAPIVAWDTVCVNDSIYNPAYYVGAVFMMSLSVDTAYHYNPCGYLNQNGTTGLLTWNLNLCNSTLTINGSGNMPDYTTQYGTSTAPWASYNNAITSVVIGDSVTSIGDFAFYWCDNLASITIPNGITSIGDYAFYACISLDSATIPNSVTTIGYHAFTYCHSLTSATIPDSLTSIGEGAFSNCNSLQTVNYNAINCTIMGNYGFTVFSSSPFSILNIGNQVKTIPDLIFNNCQYLTSVTIPNSVTSIGGQTFQNCYSLITITIPNSVTSIGLFAFSNCDSLMSINVDVNNLNYSSIDGILYNKMQDTLIQCPGGKTGTVIISDSVIVIGSGAFAGCGGLDSISIGSSVATIESGAFSGCTYLTSITIPDSVAFIGDYAFGGSNSLYTVNYNAINCTAGGNIFYGTPINTLNIGNQVKIIPDYIFYDCRYLISITIGNSVASIGDWAFSNCQYLTTLSIGNSVASIGDGAFFGCRYLTSITSKATTPPVLVGNDVFYVYNTAIPVYIPCGTYNSYNNANGWGYYFTNFVDSLTDTTFYAVASCSSFYTDDNFSNLTQDGVYYRTISTVSACDSIVCLTLSFLPIIPITSYPASICQGDIYNDDHFSNLATAGTYYDTLQNVNGCDSVVELTLTVNLPDTTLLFDSIQQGETYNKNGFSVSQAGIYTQVLRNTNGCDSVVVLHLVITGVGVKRLQVTSYELQVYPNPVNHELKIKNEELRDGSIIEIYDVVGQCVFTTPNPTRVTTPSPSKGGESSTSAQLSSFGGAGVVIDVSHLASGMYFLKVDNKVVKIIKN